MRILRIERVSASYSQRFIRDNPQNPRHPRSIMFFL